MWYRLLACVTGLAVFSTAASGETYALLVGCSEYAALKTQPDHEGAHSVEGSSK